MSQNSSIERAHSGELISITVPEGVNKMKKEKTRISYIKFFVVTLVIALSFVIAMPTVVFASEEGSSQVVDLTATEEETTDTTDTDVIVPPIDVEEPEALATAPAEEEATSDAAAVPAQPRTISLTAAGAAVLIVVIAR